MRSMLSVPDIRHLSWRAGFGANSQWQERSARQLIKKIVHGDKASPLMLTTAEGQQLQHEYQASRRLAGTDKKVIARISREGVRNLNIAWIKEMFTTENVLREKMALLWHGHFACRIQHILHNEQLLQVIRENALGNFGDLLFAVSKSPAMLQFLNNQQNRKQHPNENFAREVMELFTMGRGNYTEQDVKEGARAFTGWAFDKAGYFMFRPSLHDNGVKTFLGKTGNFNGDDILHILLEHKATAHHITGKICRFLVNDAPDEAMIRSLADKFYQSGYDIRSLLEDIFSGDWFYAPENRGARIKSPVELIVGMERTVPATFANDNALLLFQRILGQVLFYPPNVAGWPGGKDWIDSSTLMFRLRLPQIVYYSEAPGMHPKAMPDEMTDDKMMGCTMDDLMKRSLARKVRTTVQWENYLQAFNHVSEADLPRAVADALLVNMPKQVNTGELNNFSESGSKELYIRKLTINIMSTPEYQLC